MRRTLCIFAAFIMTFLLVFHVITISVRADKETEQDIYYVIPEKVEIVTQNDNLEIEAPKEVTKTIEEIKIEEFNSKLDKIKSLKEDNKEEWFQAYKDLIFEYIEWIEQPETVFDVFSEEEVKLICRVVETETYQQDFDSKVNVACVVFNRLESGDFGDTITEVVTKPYQFAYGRKNITEDTILAVMYAYEVEDTTQGALFFNSFKERKDTFCGADYIFTDNCDHHFYK